MKKPTRNKTAQHQKNILQTSHDKASQKAPQLPNSFEQLLQKAVQPFAQEHEK